MKLKMIFLCILSVCLISLTSLSVFATEATSSSGVNIQVSTNVINYPSFSMEIPTTIPMGELQRTASSSVVSKSFSVKMNAEQALSGQKVDVYLKTPDGQFVLTSGVYSLAYTVYNRESGGDPMTSGDLFASFTEAGEQKGRVEVDQVNITAEGTYAGTIQFVVVVSEVNE